MSFFFVLESNLGSHFAFSFLASLFSSNLWHILGFPLFFMILTLWRALVRSLIECPQAWVMSWLSGGQGCWEDHRGEVSFPAHRIRRTWVTSVYPISGHANLYPLVKVVSARLLNYFAINKHFRETLWGEAKGLFLLDLCVDHVQPVPGSSNSMQLVQSTWLLWGSAGLPSSIFPQLAWGNNHLPWMFRGGGSRWKALLLFTYGGSDAWG